MLLASDDISSAAMTGNGPPPPWAPATPTLPPLPPAHPRQAAADGRHSIIRCSRSQRILARAGLITQTSASKSAR